MLLSLVSTAGAEPRYDRPGSRGQVANPTAEAPGAPHGFIGRLPGGPIRTLFVAPAYTLLDATELGKRIPLQLDLLPIGQSGVSSTREALAKARLLDTEHEVVVVANLDFAALDQNLRESILAKVARGAGLVMVYVQPATSPELSAYFAKLGPPRSSTEALLAGIGPGVAPGWASDLEILEGPAAGGGRVALFNTTAEPPLTHAILPPPANASRAEPPYYENTLLFMAKILFWAAGRDSTIWIRTIEDAAPKGPDDAEIPPRLPAEFIQRMRDAAVQTALKPYRLHFNRVIDDAYGIKIRVRYPHRNIMWTLPEIPLPKGVDTHLLQLPVGHGDFFLDVSLSGKKGVLDWYTKALHVQGWPEIAEFEVSKAVLQPNDSLTVSCSIRPHYHAPRPCTLYVRATDALGRIVQERYVPVSPEGGNLSVTLDFVDLIATSLKIEVFAADLKAPPFHQWAFEHADYAFVYALVRQEQGDDFHFLADGLPAFEFNARTYNRVLRDLGVETLHLPAAIPPDFAAALDNLKILPHIANYSPGTRTSDAVRMPCLSDPTFRSQENAQLREAMAALWPLSSGVYSLGDRNALSLTDSPPCQSPTCLKRFQDGLSERYGAIASLNQAWNTRFSSWDAIVPGALDEGPPFKTLPGRLAFQRSMDDLFTETHTVARYIVRGIDRKARVGLCAIASPRVGTGYDWWQLASQLDFFGLPFDPLTVEKVRSYRSPEAFAYLRFRGGEAGASEAEGRWLPWYAALHGLQGVWIETPYGTREQSAAVMALSPEGKPAPWLDEAANAVAEIRSGIGALLARATPSNCGIAIYGSQSSRFVNAQDTAFRCQSRQAEAACVRLLESLGYQFDFLSHEQALRGELARYKVLILPMVRALSDAEVQVLRKFHTEGGALLADIAPGQYDAHGSLRETPPLAERFGILHEGPVRPAAPGPALVTAGREEGFDTPVLQPAIPDESVVPVQAKVSGWVGDVPIWLTPLDESPRALLLNHPFPNLESAPEFRRFVEDWLRRSGATQPISALPTETSDFEGERFHLRYGDAELFAFLSDPLVQKKQQKLKFRVPKDRYAFDLRTGTSFAPGRKFSAQVGAGDAALLALLPYEVSRLLVEAPSYVKAGTRLPIQVTVKTRGGLPRLHLVRIAIRPKGGTPPHHYDRTVECLGGQGATYIPLAFNEKPGPYSITVTEVLTGITGTVETTVLPR